MIYDVLIIGAGAAGYGCALTLSSVEKTKEFAKNKNYLMIDAGKTDMHSARFFNLSGVDFGILGDDLLVKMQKQLENYESCKLSNDTVTKISKIDDLYVVNTQTNVYQAKIVVIATGMHKFDIELENIDIEILVHDKVLKPNKIKLKHNDNEISENLYVAGLASGAMTMFSIANGDGTKVACQIFKKWSGQYAVAHDNK